MYELEDESSVSPDVSFRNTYLFDVRSTREIRPDRRSRYSRSVRYNVMRDKCNSSIYFAVSAAFLVCDRGLDTIRNSAHIIYCYLVETYAWNRRALERNRCVDP